MNKLKKNIMYLALKKKEVTFNNSIIFLRLL